MNQALGLLGLAFLLTPAMGAVLLLTALPFRGFRGRLTSLGGLTVPITIFLYVAVGR